MQNAIDSSKSITKMDSEPLIVFKSVSKTFGDGKALSDVSFSIPRGAFVCFIGPSGSGKSTIVKIIAGLEAPPKGNVTRPENVSLVFQSGALFPWLTVFDNVALPLRVRGAPEAEVRRETARYLLMTGLSAFAGKYPRELSGGQHQRVGIARALVVDPEVLLLDEPFSALDIKTTEELHRDVTRIWKETKNTVVMISHSIEEAVELADTVIVMKGFGLHTSFSITLPRPRRTQMPAFMHEVMRIRREFFEA